MLFEDDLKDAVASRTAWTLGVVSFAAAQP